MNVLIVDDSRFTRALLRRELSEEFEVWEASDGTEALEMIEHCQPDLVLVDLLMPRLNGFDFVRLAREEGFEAPIIVCTANTQPAVETRILELGATEFVTKPELLVPGRARSLARSLLIGHEDADKECGRLSEGVEPPQTMGPARSH